MRPALSAEVTLCRCPVSQGFQYRRFREHPLARQGPSEPLLSGGPGSKVSPGERDWASGHRGRRLGLSDFPPPRHHRGLGEGSARDGTGAAWGQRPLPTSLGVEADGPCRRGGGILWLLSEGSHPSGGFLLCECCLHKDLQIPPAPQAQGLRSTVTLSSPTTSKQPRGVVPRYACSCLFEQTTSSQDSVLAPPST